MCPCVHFDTCHDDAIKWKHTGPLRGESTGHRWILLTKTSDAGLWWFLWSAPEQTVKQTIETPVFETPSRSLWHHCNVPSQCWEMMYANTFWCFHRTIWQGLKHNLITKMSHEHHNVSNTDRKNVCSTACSCDQNIAVPMWTYVRANRR